SRPLRDRRAMARYAGLTGAPDESGARRRETIWTARSIPLISQLEYSAGFARDDAVEQRIGKLTGVAYVVRGDAEIELLAEMLSLPSTAAELIVSPQRKRQMLFDALLHQLEVLAKAGHPVIEGA